jgi:hypothetical protein
MRLLGLTLVAVGCISWVLGGNRIIGRRQRRSGEKPLLFDLRPLPRLSGLTSRQKRSLVGLLAGVAVVILVGLTMAQGAFASEFFAVRANFRWS